MDIRIASIEDAYLLARMNHSLIRDEGHRNSMGMSELASRMSEWLKSGYEATIFEEQGEPIGYALWRDDSDYLYLRQFYIRSEMRRLGKGSEAIGRLKRDYWSGNRLRLEVLIGNKAAQEFWCSVGFENYCITMECNNA